MQRTRVAILLVLLTFSAGTLLAEKDSSSSDEAQANNPSELDDQNANTFFLRYAQPFGKWLMRTSLPVSRVPTGTSTAGAQSPDDGRDREHRD